MLIKLQKSQELSSQNTSDTVTNKTENIELDREIPKEGYIPP